MLTFSKPPNPKHDGALLVLQSLRRSPSNEGFSHLAIDGVYRSYDSKGEVVDYRKLSPEEISMMLSFQSKHYTAEQNLTLLEKFRGVDGTSVTDEQQLLHPEAALRPQRPSERGVGNQ